MTKGRRAAPAVNGGDGIDDLMVMMLTMNRRKSADQLQRTDPAVVDGQTELAYSRAEPPSFRPLLGEEVVNEARAATEHQGEMTVESGPAVADRTWHCSTD